MKTKRVFGAKLFLFCVVLVYLFWVCSPIYSAEKILISIGDLQMLETNLTEARTLLEKQKKQEEILKTQLTTSQNELTSAEKSLNELRANVEREMNKKLWMGIGIGVGGTAVVTLVVLLATGVIRT